MGVGIGVHVGVLVGVTVGVAVGVRVGVRVGVAVGVGVGVDVGVGVAVGVAEGVEVGVRVGVGVGVGPPLPNVNAPGSVAVWKSGFMTTTSSTPAAWAGVTTVRLVEEMNVTEAAAVLPARSAKATRAPLWKPVPVMTVLVPPPVGPDVTLRPVIVGAAPPIAKMQLPLAALMLPFRYSERLRRWKTSSFE